jgi:plastocyanin
MKKYILGISMMIAVVVIAFAACSKSGNSDPKPDPDPAPPTTTPVATAAVSIKNFAYSKATVNLKVGGTVTWTNEDTAPHTVTDQGGAFDSQSIATNAKFAHTFPTAGTYTYHCTFHSTMASAKIVVTK